MTKAAAESVAPAAVEAADGVELVVATHDALFDTARASCCDACGDLLPPADADEGYGVPGQGVYMWTRGEDVRIEPAPLCASCASAIGMTALARWEIEEEEG